MEEIDRVNNIGQKEARLALAGVTRFKAYKVVADALVATRWGKSDKPNPFTGQYDIVEQPDFEKNKWGAEMAGKYFSDLKELQPIVIPPEALEPNKIKVDQVDLDERIRKITHATVTTMEAQRIVNDHPNP